MGRRASRRPNGFINRFIELGASTLRSHLDVPEAAAIVAMREAVHRICSEYGGEAVYLPKDREFALDMRDARLAAEHAAGVETLELARRYSISSRQVQYIVKLVREQEKAGRMAAATREWVTSNG